MSKFINTMHQDNQECLEVLKKGNSDRQQNYELQILRAQNESKKIAVTEYREDNKILFTDLDSIKDPNLREFMRSEHARIMRKRAQQQGEGSQNTSNIFGQFFTNLGGSGDDLPPILNYMFRL